MTKTIVIMRHAKAKRPVEGQPDIERPLSEAGQRSMRATTTSNSRVTLTLSRSMKSSLTL